MRHMQKFILFFCALALVADNAYAYFDPGTASVIMQTVVTAILGSVLALKIFWQRLKNAVKRLFSRSEKAEESDG